MATQREYEAVVWHFLSDTLKNTPPHKVEEWFFALRPATHAQHKRWNDAIHHVLAQIGKYQGEEELCHEDCAGYHV